MALTWFPACIQIVVRLPGCPLILFPCWPFARYIVRAIFDSAFAAKSTGSEYATVPRGMVIEADPLKVKPAMGDASIALTPAFPEVGRASEAAVMGRSVVPKVLENWIRRRVVAMERCKVWRIVASLKTLLEVF